MKSYSIKSTINNEWNNEWNNTHPEWYELCKNWKTLFGMIDFNVFSLYDNRPNYWSCDHVEYVFNRLVELRNNPENFVNEYDMNVFIKCKLDLDKLIELFQVYVNEKCVIYVY